MPKFVCFKCRYTNDKANAPARAERFNLMAKKKSVSAFDNIKGYKDIKGEMLRVLDIMKNPDIYEKLGATIPTGLLLVGRPGTGKSSLCQALITESGWNTITIRKDKPNGEFVNYIKKCFLKAAEMQPCIIYLDDMDKVSNSDSDHDDTEEYVTIQSCIDTMPKGKIFLLATANNPRKLPKSLKRPGRFDIYIEVPEPSYEDAVEIVTYYLNEKKHLKDIDPEVVAELLAGESCAQLEEIIASAARRAAFERRKCVSMEDIIAEFLKHNYNAKDTFRQDHSDRAKAAAIHEAGHALVSEFFDPNSVKLISIADSDGGSGGLTCCRNTPVFLGLEGRRRNIMVGLGGRAATEIVFQEVDTGATGDMERAQDIARELVTEIGAHGFDKTEHGYRTSDAKTQRIEQATAMEVENAYAEAKKIISAHEELLFAIADSLTEKTTITRTQLQEIIQKHPF